MLLPTVHLQNLVILRTPQWILWLIVRFAISLSPAWKIRKFGELLAIVSLTLADAVSNAVSLEVSFAESKLYDSSSLTPNVLPSLPVNRVTQSPASCSTACKYCEESHVPSLSHCPATGKKRSHCGKVGHFAKVCRSTQHGSRQAASGHANAVEQEDSACVVSPDVDDVARDLAYVAGASTSPHDKRFLITLTVDRMSVQGLLDTGATHTLCSLSVVSPDDKACRKLCAYDGKEVPTLGRLTSVLQATTGSPWCGVLLFRIKTSSVWPVRYQGSESGHSAPGGGKCRKHWPLSIKVSADAIPVASPCR